MVVVLWHAERRVGEYRPGTGGRAYITCRSRRGGCCNTKWCVENWGIGRIRARRHRSTSRSTKRRVGWSLFREGGECVGSELLLRRRGKG